MLPLWSMADKDVDELLPRAHLIDPFSAQPPQPLTVTQG
jgi:hypothetical protein